MVTFISYCIIGFGIYMVIGGLFLLILGYLISYKANLL